VASRPVFHKELGEFFESLREAHGWTQRQAGDIAARRKLNGLSRQVLLRLENGRTKNPEPNVLRALADLYEMSYEEIAARFIAVRFGLSVSARDLGWQPSKGQSAPLNGGADAPAATRLLKELTNAQRTIREMSVAANQIAALAAEQITTAEGRFPGRSGSGRRKGRRDAS
jgi:transcriptional regulator with XRE-family HTH domain